MNVIPMPRRGAHALLPPEQKIVEMNRIFPGLWKYVDARRAKHSRSWPGWCFFPRDEMTALTEPLLRQPRNDDERLRQWRWMRYATILAPWRVSKNVYRFDPDIYLELLDTPISGPLPADLFFRLPEWALYIETPGLESGYGDTSTGFVVSLNYADGDPRAAKLHLLSFVDGRPPFIDWMFVREGMMIEESLTEALNAYHSMLSKMTLSKPWERMNAKDELVRVTKMLNLVLYICQTNAADRDIRNVDGSDSVPHNPSPRKTKKGLRYFPPAKPTIWGCGMRQGAQLRRARARHAESKRGTHDGPIPHTRAAHWHTYIVGKGSRKDPSKGKRVLKWVHTILVNADKGDVDVPVIHAVD